MMTISNPLIRKLNRSLREGCDTCIEIRNHFADPTSELDPTVSDLLKDLRADLMLYIIKFDYITVDYKEHE